MRRRHIRATFTHATAAFAAATRPALAAAYAASALAASLGAAIPAANVATAVLLPRSCGDQLPIDRLPE